MTTDSEMHVLGTEYVYPRLLKPAETALQLTSPLKEILMDYLSTVLFYTRARSACSFPKGWSEKEVAPGSGSGSSA